jgi:hypothetical protein
MTDPRIPQARQLARLLNEGKPTLEAIAEVGLDPAELDIVLGLFAISIDDPENDIIDLGWKDGSSLLLRRLLKGFHETWWRLERSHEIPPGGGLLIYYDGPPVAVDASKIGEDWEWPVPDVGQWDVEPFRTGDEYPGEVAATLFSSALSAGALVCPPHLDIQCYGVDDQAGSGFVLVAFPSQPIGYRAGATRGWMDISNIAASGDQKPDDRGLIIEALDTFAREINLALGIL